MKNAYSSTRTFLLITFSLLTFSKAVAQDVLWEKSYGGKHADYLFDVVATPDYGFILAGSSLSKKTGNKTEDNAGDLDYWVWKMDEKGDLDWQKCFGGEGADLLKCIRLTNDGGFILAGTSNSEKGPQKNDLCQGMEDFWIIKLDAKGNEQWQRTIGGSGQEILHSISPTTDGGYIIGGSSASQKSKNESSATNEFYGKSENSFGNLDYWVVKVDAKGKIEWQRTLGGKYSDMLRSVEQTKDGGYILGGSSNSPQSGNKTQNNIGEGDYWIIKLNNNGEIEWQEVFGGEQDDQLYAVHQMNDTNFIIAGNSASNSTGNKNKANRNGIDFWVLKIDQNGNIIWQENYNTGKVDFFTSLIENEDHTFLLGGHSQSEVSGKNKVDNKDVNDYIVIKIDENGEELWRKTVGSSGQDILRKAIEVRDGGYLLAGTSKGKVSRDKNSGNGNEDYWVVKLKDKNKKKENPLLIEAIPNPAENFTNIIVGYDFLKGTAIVYDLSGRQLQRFSISDRTVPIDLTGLPEGIYIVQIKTDESTNAVKVIKGLNKN